MIIRIFVLMAILAVHPFAKSSGDILRFQSMYDGEGPILNVVYFNNSKERQLVHFDFDFQGIDPDLLSKHNCEFRRVKVKNRSRTLSRRLDQFDFNRKNTYGYITPGSFAHRRFNAPYYSLLPCDLTSVVWVDASDPQMSNFTLARTPRLRPTGTLKYTFSHIAEKTEKGVLRLVVLLKNKSENDGALTILRKTLSYCRKGSYYRLPHELDPVRVELYRGGYGIVETGFLEKYNVSPNCRLEITVRDDFSHEVNVLSIPTSAENTFSETPNFPIDD